MNKLRFLTFTLRYKKKSMNFTKICKYPSELSKFLKCFPSFVL